MRPIVAPVRPINPLVAPVRPLNPMVAPVRPVAPQMPAWMNGGMPPGIQQMQQRIPQMPQIPVMPQMPAMPTVPNAVNDIVSTPPLNYARNINSKILAPAKPIMFNGQPLSKYKL